MKYEGETTRGQRSIEELRLGYGRGYEGLGGSSVHYSFADQSDLRVDAVLILSQG